MIAGGLQTVERKLRGNVLGGNIASSLARSTALQ
jgi:hypothetical protein